jgi:hypothetical protein
MIAGEGLDPVLVFGRTLQLGWGIAMDSTALHELIAQVRAHDGRARRSRAKGRIIYG